MEKDKSIRIISIFIVAILWLILSFTVWLHPVKDISISERRPLSQFPEISANSILSGEFVKDFESFTVDQFPSRDAFRQIKSIFQYYVLQQKDNHNIYIEDGYAVKMEYPLNEKSLENANKYFDKIYQKYLKNTNVKSYISVVPDKNYYLGNWAGSLIMSYDKLFDSIESNNLWATYIDIVTELSFDDYYRTDTHWKQEEIIGVARKICEEMGTEWPNENNFTLTKIDKPFYGVYYGQAALPMKPDDMYILNNEIIKQCIVKDYETGKTTKIYDKSMISSQDLYDIYLSGAKALISIENPNASTDKELIIFRDSFGSSLAPLLIQSYSKITLIDIRYISVDYIDKFIEFNNQDVLFLYSTLILNSSFSFK